MAHSFSWNDFLIIKEFWSQLLVNKVSWLLCCEWNCTTILAICLDFLLENTFKWEGKRRNILKNQHSLLYGLISCQIKSNSNIILDTYRWYLVFIKNNSITRVSWIEKELVKNYLGIIFVNNWSSQFLSIFFVTVNQLLHLRSRLFGHNLF